jgi:DNA-binding response OmpR family regulator
MFQIIGSILALATVVATLAEAIRTVRGVGYMFVPPKD